MITPQLLEEGESIDPQKYNKKFRHSYEPDNLNESYSQKGVSFKTEDEFKIDTNPMKKSNFGLTKHQEQKQSSYNNKPTWLPLDDEGFNYDQIKL